MAAQGEGRGTPRGNRIDITAESECRYWAERLGVRQTELEAAVGAVGNEVNDVWLYVDRLKHDDWQEAPPASRRCTD